MGGGGSFYDRDVQDGYVRTTAGYSTDAQEKMSRRQADPGLLPGNGRRVVCSAESPVVFAFDVTGSMGTLPRIIYDKMPLIAGQIVECGYLQDPAMSLAAVGDILSDQGPIQIGEFSPVRKLDDWLQRIWLEGNGGGQAKESYEFTAYYYARRCDLTNAKTPFFLITGDEGFRETLYANDLVRHFGGQHENVQATQVFAELDKKFNGNVFLIRRQYSGKENDEIQGQWERLLGKERVVPLKSDQAIADITLGVFALMTGARTLEEYLDDLKTKRAIPQTDERIEEVRQSLGMLAELQSKRVPVQAAATRPAPSLAQPPEEPPARKRGRIF